MPTVLTNDPPPRPPDLHMRAQITDAVAAVQTESRYLFALIVWLTQKIAAIIAAVAELQANVAGMLSWVPLVGLRNGTNHDFTIAAGAVRTGANGRPLAWVYQGGAQIPYTANPSPGPFQWTMIGQTFVLGTAPTGSELDEPIVAQADIA